MKNYSEFITEVNKHREDKLKGQLKGLEQKYQQEYNDRYMKPFQNKEVKKAQGETLKQGNTYLAQIAPMKSNFIGTNMQSLPHMDLRGPGEKMMSVINQKRFYDSDYGKMQGGPPKGP